MIIGIIGLVLTLIFAYRTATQGSNFEIGPFFGGIGTGVFVFGLILIFGQLVVSSNHQHTEYMDLPIASLSLDKSNEINGSFILGTGSIHGDEVEYYITYGIFNQGLQRVKVDAYDCFIKETNIIKPKILNYKHRTVYESFKNKWFFGKSYVHYGPWEDNYNNITIIVPLNTLKVKEQFNIDK